MNLRGNRISSLCGIERLLSIEKLDVRDNDIQDASEIARLVTLPHLTDIWIGEGNPFLEDTSAHRGHGWRLAFFEAFLRVPDNAYRRQIADLPRVDGTQPSWYEHRRLSNDHIPYEVSPNRPRAGRETATWPRNGQRHEGAPTRDVSDVQIKTLRSRRSRNLTEDGSRDARSKSPPPPVPLPPKALEGSVAPIEAAPLAKVVKKRHRRIVDLDAGKPAGDPTGKDSSSQSHHRSRSQPGDVLGPSTAPSRVSESQPRHKTLPKQARNQLSNKRALASNTFDDPSLDTVKAPQIDSGSEAEEFRKKMEKLREEVGAGNWLSVYANTVHSRQEA